MIPKEAHMTTHSFAHTHPQTATHTHTTEPNERTERALRSNGSWQHFCRARASAARERRALIMACWKATIANHRPYIIHMLDTILDSMRERLPFVFVVAANRCAFAEWCEGVPTDSTEWFFPVVISVRIFRV